MKQTPLPAATVFISYAHIDWDRVRPIVDAFDAWEWIVASDQDDLNRGEQWRDAMEPRVASSYTLVVAWSKTSVASKAVLEEVEWALKKHSRIKFLPVIVEAGTRPPEHLWTNEGVDLTDWNHKAHDPLFERVRVGIENHWTIDNDMALIRGTTAMKTIRVIKKRVVPRGTQLPPTGD